MGTWLLIRHRPRQRLLEVRAVKLGLGARSFKGITDGWSRHLARRDGNRYDGGQLERRRPSHYVRWRTHFAFLYRTRNSSEAGNWSG
jgi:hypothetical protein